MPLIFHPDGKLVQCPRAEFEQYIPVLEKEGFKKKKLGMMDECGHRYMVEFQLDIVLINPSMLLHMGISIDNVPIAKSWKEISRL